MKNKISNQYKEKYQNVNLSGFYENRYNSLVKCDEPLIVIASVMRSGGNLLNRLLDGHKELRTYHSELLFGVMSDISSTNEALNISRFPIFQSELDFNKFCEITEGRKTEDSQYCIDSSLIKDELGWEAKITLDEGVDEVVQWVKKYQDILINEPQSFTLRA